MIGKFLIGLMLVGTFCVSTKAMADDWGYGYNSDGQLVYCYGYYADDGNLYCYE